MKETLVNFNTSTYINESSREYSLYVLENRGIPSVWDGLKDGQRKALFLLQNKSGEIKTVSLAGEMISSGLYVHGDTAASDSIGKLAAPYLNNMPLIKGIGGFGTKTVPSAISAPRYTYVKKSQVTEKILYPDHEVLDMVENYDGSAFSPSHYVPLIPTVLLNGVTGMAPGFSTNILPRSLKGLIKATIDVLNGKLPSTLQPQYESCAGNVVSLGEGRYEFYGIATVLDGQTINISELPPGMTHESFIERLNIMCDNNSIKNYTDDTSDNINITVKFIRGSIATWTNDDAIRFFNLVTRDKDRIIVINWDGKTVKEYNSAAELVIEYVQKRFNYYVRRYERLKRIDSKKLQFELLIKACLESDILERIKTFKTKSDLYDAIEVVAKTNNLSYTDDDINSACSLPTYKWIKDEIRLVDDKIDNLNLQISNYNRILGNNELIWNIYRDEVKSLLATKFDSGRE